MPINPHRHSTFSRSIARSKPLRVVVAYGFIAAQFVLATPQGEQVVSGQATFNRQGNTTQITAGHNAIINYSGFDIHSHETVRFVQPSAASRVLNRVSSPNPTRIAGTLQANGQVYITNPSGVIFTNGALIDVGAIYAAAADISNADFLNNIDRFTSASGPVINHGTISADFVALVGQHVANYGTIVADEGTVTMIAGDDVLIGRFDNHLMVKLSGAAAHAANTPDPGVTNAGTINAHKGTVRLGAGDMYSLVLQQGSEIKADKIVVQGGLGATVAVAGSLDVSNTAPGGVGGDVTIVGDHVTVDGAHINASGDAGGGQVLIGVDAIDDPRTVMATRTRVTGDTHIEAQALTTGDGGFVEISGHTLGYTGVSLNLLAANGNNGVLLLDPVDLTVGINAGGTPGVDMPGQDDGFVSAAELVLALDGADVILQADNSITIAEAISATGAPGILTLTAPTLNLSADINMGSGGSLMLDGAANIGANITLTTADGGTVTLGGDVTLGTNHLIVEAPTTLDTALVLNAGTGFLFFNQAVTSGFGLQLEGDSTSNIILNNPGNDIAGTVSVNVPGASNSVSIINNGSIVFDDSVLGGTLNAIALAGTITNTPGQSITVSGGSAIFTADGPGGAITIDDLRSNGGTLLVHLSTPGMAQLASSDGMSLSGAVGSLDATSTSVSQPLGISASGLAITNGQAVLTANNILLKGGIVTDANPINIQGDVLLGSAMVVLDTTNNGASPGGADVVFNSGIDSESVALPSAFVINAGTTGNIDVPSIIGGSDALASVQFAAQTMTLNSVITLGSQDYVAVGADPLITINGRFESTGPEDFVSDTDIEFEGDVVLTGSTLVVNHNGFVVFGDNVTDDDKGVRSLALFAIDDASGGIALARGIDISGSLDAQVIGGGSILTMADVQASQINFNTDGRLQTQGVTSTAGPITMTAASTSLTRGLWARGDITANGGGVMLTSTGGGIEVNNITVDGVAGDGIALQSNTSLSPEGVAGRLPLGLITINSTLLTNGGDITLNAGSPALAEVPSVATIIGTGNVTLDTRGPAQTEAGNVVIGHNQKTTVRNNFTILTGGGDATIGDVTAGGSIDINTTDGAIIFQLRRPAFVLLPNGQLLQDVSVDLVAQGNISLTGSTYGTLNTGPAPRLATQQGVITTNVPGGSAITPAIAQVVSGDLRNAQGRWLDGTTGVLVGGLDTSVAFFVAPINEELLSISSDLFVQQSEKEMLQAMGIPAANLTSDDLLQYVTDGQAWLINDIAPPHAEPGEHTVTVARMLPGVVPEALEIYKDLFVGMDLDDEGNFIAIDKTPYIREALTKAWIDYLAVTSEMGPMDFEQYLRAAPESLEALNYVVLLRSLFERFGIMGLTDRELDYVKVVLLKRQGVIPDGMTLDQFSDVVLKRMPSAAVPFFTEDKPEKRMRSQTNDGGNFLSDQPPMLHGFR